MWRIKIGAAGLAALVLNVAALAAVSTARLEQRAREALRLPTDAARGQLLYEQNCGGCHGQQAHGDVIRLIPALAGQRRSYLVKHVAELNDAERAAAHMHPVLESAELTQPQGWADLAEYLQRCAPLQVRGGGNEELALRGARNYRRWCASCHGEDAGGNETKFVPSLRHQHRQYLLKELRMVAAAHRLSVRSDIMNVLDSLHSDAIAGIADHVSELGSPQRTQ